MKVLLLGILYLSLGLTAATPDCDSLKLETTITHTSDGNSNGKIEVNIEKGNAPFKVFLFADKKSDNKLDVKLKDLKDLASGNYILVIQDKDGCNYQETIKIN